RERRGVYYTPEPVVSYIVRSLNAILKERFGRQDGFATQSVTVLDPAGGTLTFLAEAAKLAVEEFVGKYGEGSKAKFIEDHILKHFFAFELMMAPYAAGHLKMGYLLEELGHKLTGDERFQFYLTNTLEMEELAQTSLPGMASLSEESHLAGKVKRERPILVILGNPPYSGHSANKGDWIKDQIETYKRVDGKPLGEKNPKWLQDDYVKFIRFAQWKIDQIGEGVLGFITNHGYLDNPTFRGMRQSLMDSFDEIYILDLHGNSLKKEKAPDGSKDENVFDIQQGVAIALFVKRKQSVPRKTLMHSEIWGAREQKYEWLIKHELKKTDWSRLKPVSPFYLFVPRDERLNKRFQSYLSIPAIFPVNSVGIVTARDHLTIHWTSHQVWTTVLNFASLDPEIARQAYQLGNDARDWKVKLAQEDLKKSGPTKGNIVPILYRPFDIRYTYYTGNSKGFHCMPRGGVMRHMLQPNLALLTHRREEIQIPYTHFLVTNLISEHGVLSSKTTNYHFPLYLYLESQKTKRNRITTLMLFEPEMSYTVKRKVANIASELLETLTSNYNRQLTPEDIFNYIYSIVYSNAYRKKYAEFLKTDFPRIPFTKDYLLFKKLAEKGEELVELHLLKSKKLIKPIARCEGSGDLRVVKVTYDQKKGHVHINPEKWFAGVPPEVWEYHIGGYQVAEKWLKYRKGKGLSSEEVAHYARVVTTIAETISIQESLDALFKEVETSLLEVKL
ncbi:MAG: type ISP restriction/modification enzyme, partial [Deltaproteobacteria bacterium]|nr:type ISP restriction/modification enzyme [Deltaproteobacteria bacterium]